MSVLRSDARDAVADVVFDGMTIALGGFGLSGVPADLIDAVVETGVRDLTVVSNVMGIDGAGPGLLLESGQVSRVVSSYVGGNRLFAQLYMDGEIDVELTPQGTLAERVRAGGAGIPAFYTKTGVGTLAAEGKRQEVFDGETYLMERAIVSDLSLVRAHTADEWGNLTYRLSAENFNPLVATCGRVTVAEAEEVVAAGEIDPDRVKTPSVYVDRLIRCIDREKLIEQRTTRPRPAESARTEEPHGLDA
ncbi:MAG: CoA transferase subunit A [Nesterenkonia sp.]|uniref:CoA transferase subunit A n=1 Tax=Nesterenkonia marinintestina TaxID=2979865 RepID=UPI0021C0CE9F|nr:CoA transferase subunit A [Nesterenkonia sp. GX14115]MDO5492554.1 CoA transferase subunit A [Nesterenkonia sp.]